MTKVDAGGFVSTATVGEASAWLSGARSVVITTHSKPDGDAVGSSVALARALAARDPGVGVEVWYSGVLPDFLQKMTDGVAVRHLDQRPPTDADQPDAVVIVDTGAWSQLAAVRGFLETRADRTLIVDHHLSGDSAIASRLIVEPTCAAAAQIVSELCCALLGRSARELPLDIATPLYLGLATDTGWFRFSSVTPETMRLGADLIEAGVNHTELFGMIEQQDRPGRLRLFGRALQSLELLDNDRVALMMIRERDYAETGARPGDTGGFADRALVVASVMVAAVLNETKDHDGRTVTKVSMRSKNGPGAVNVNEAAATLGGGGHARAAGARHDGDLAATRRLVLESLGVKAEG